MQGGATPPGLYRGFRATGAMMRALAQVDPSVGGAHPTPGDGFL